MALAARGPYGAADVELVAVRALPPRAEIAREMAAVRRAEIHASTALAGSTLEPGEVDALLDRDRAHGGHRFSDYVLVRAYADAARWVAELRAYPAGDRRQLLALDELRALNARALTGSSLRGGAWRQGNPVSPGGIVAPAAWLVTREVSALLDRFGRGPQDEPVALWIARFLGRFARLVPFEGGNGRTARLAANAMLRRLDAVPLVFDRRERARFAAAVGAAETNAPGDLAALVTAAIVRTCRRVRAAGESVEAVVPLREIAGPEYAALAKAAQRGRLRTIVRGSRYFTTPGWIAEYRATRPPRAARESPR